MTPAGAEVERELKWFRVRLRQHFVAASVSCRETLRQAILDADLGPMICGRAPGGKPERYAERFARVFGEPLERA